MAYAKVLKLPQYFRNFQRLSEIVRVLIKHGFGDLVTRLNLTPYLANKLDLVSSTLHLERREYFDFSTRLRLVFEELGPTFIKFAQLIATRPDIFPESITTEFKKLQDKVPPFSLALVRDRIEQELQRPVEEIFLSFEEKPLAAASIAQVHRAKLKSGIEVVVKVQRPNLDRIFAMDTEILLGLATLIEERIPESLQFNPFKLVEEFCRNLKNESDFEREARSMERFSARFRDLPLLVIPTVYRQYSTKRVLTQTYIQGVRADSLAAHPGEKPRAKEIVQTLNHVILRSIFEDGFFHADPHPGNVLLTPDGHVALIDFGAMGHLDPSRISQVLRFLLAILNRDLDRLLKVLYENQVAPRTLDEVRLRTQVVELLDNYMGLPLGQISLSALMSEVFEVVRQHGIRPPADLLLVGKSITSLQYIGVMLDPEFDPVGSIKPYLFRRYSRQITDPKVYARYWSDVAESSLQLLHDLPTDLRGLVKNLAHDDFKLTYRDEYHKATQDHQNRMLNRGIMAGIGIALMFAGVGVMHVDNAPLTASYLLLAWGAIVLFITWFAIRRSGGT